MAEKQELRGAGWIGAITGSVGAAAAIFLVEKLRIPPSAATGLIIAGAEAGLLLDPGYRRLVGNVLRETGSLLRKGRR